MPDRAVSLPEGGIVVREIGSLSDHGGDIPTAYRHLRLFVVDGVLEAVVDGKSYRLQRGIFWIALVARSACGVLRPRHVPTCCS